MCDVTITRLSLTNNGLTKSSSNAISNITISCKVKELDISHNDSVGEDRSLYSIISDPSSLLEELDMYYTKLSSSAAIKLFTALNESKNLRILGIACNEISDEARDAIIMAMKKNTSLVELYMHGNPFSGECAKLIVQALQHNNTLQGLHLPKGYIEDDEVKVYAPGIVSYTQRVQQRIRLLAIEVNKERENRGCQVKLSVGI